MNSNKPIDILEMADAFLVMADDLVNKKDQDMSHVGNALRYAAARYSAHEAAYKSVHLAEELDGAQQWFTDQFQHVLSENLKEQLENETKK